VQTRIFERAEMSDSCFLRLDALPERTAIGYIEADGTWRTKIYNLPVVGGPDGGAFSTAAAMAKFWSALDRDLILGRKWRERFLRPHVPTPTFGVFYGLGVWIHQRPERPRLDFLEGEMPGSASHRSMARIAASGTPWRATHRRVQTRSSSCWTTQSSGSIGANPPSPSRAPAW
jgi:CubicO group peptidase (beta-lactamase class C family)